MPMPMPAIKFASARWTPIHPQRLFIAVLLLCLLLSACTGHLLQSELNTSEPVSGEGFVIVTVKSQDTFSSLAQSYLNDPRKGWWIAAYNGVDTLAAGQKLVIPLEPITYGGLQTNGYQTVPVLLYYQVEHEAKNPRITNEVQFEQQLVFLKENGFRTIHLDELNTFIAFKDTIPPRAVIISFDTVGTWVYEIAYPLLKKHGMTAAIFITTEDIDKPGNLSWSQLTQMAVDGFDIGTLGRSGKDLLKLRPNEKAEAYLNRLEGEITEAKADIEARTGKECHYFAYPNGETNDLITAMLKKHGFQAAFTRKRGSNPFFVEPFQLRRSLIYGHYDLSQFKQNLATFRSAELK
jgi:peptidoglycan/xylan/chitin deacetylase (PgdA/CDA1 family)